MHHRYSKCDMCVCVCVHMSECEQGEAHIEAHVEAHIAFPIGYGFGIWGPSQSHVFPKPCSDLVRTAQRVSFSLKSCHIRDWNNSTAQRGGCLLTRG